MERFSKEISSTDIANLLYDCKQATDEPVQTFYYRVLRVVQKKNEKLSNDQQEYNDQCDRDHYILYLNGIRQDIRTAILGVAQPPETSKDALKAAINVERQREASKSVSSMFSVSTIDSRGITNGSSSSRGRSRGGRGRGGRGRGFRSQGTWYDKQMESMRGKCWQCGNPGHLKSKCNYKGDFKNVSSVALSDAEPVEQSVDDVAKGIREITWEDKGTAGSAGLSQFFQ